MEDFQSVYKKLKLGVKKNDASAENVDRARKDGLKKRAPIRRLPEVTVKNNKKARKQSEKINEMDTSAGIQIFAPTNKEEKVDKENVEESTVKDVADQANEKKVQEIRRLNKIYTWGDAIPDPFLEFSDLGLPESLIQNLKVHFQIEVPSPIQMQSIPIMLQDRDVLASAPTGSGKTLAFGIPVILTTLCAINKRSKKNPAHKLMALVLEPTKLLAKQTHEHFKKFCQGLPIHCEYLSDEISSECHILVTTPNKLIFTLDKMEDDSRIKLLKDLRWLVVDESDRMFDTTEGDQSFRSQLAKIIKYCDGKFTRRAFFSATFSYQVEEWCNENLVNVAMVCIGARNSANSAVTQELVFAGWEQGKVSAIKQLVRSGFNPPALVFVQSKDRAKQLYVELSACFKDISIKMISSEISEAESDDTIDKFRKGELSMLICTELLGRGLDLPNVNLVINFDLPTSIVSYIHRIGRTGRAGRSGKAITYFTEADMSIIRPIATVVHQAGFKVADYLLRLNKVSKRQKAQLHKHAPKRKNVTHARNWRTINKKKKDPRRDRKRRVKNSSKVEEKPINDAE